METKFKKGQKVWDCVNHTGIVGVVVEIRDSGSVFRVEVDFGDINDNYTLDGRRLIRSKPTLSVIPYAFELPKQPDTFEPGELVLVRREDDELWVPFRVPEGYISWVQMIKFDAELALTKKKP